MSERAFQAFVEAAKKDPALAEGAQSAVADLQGNEASAALAAYARARSYDVTDDDVVAAMAASAAPDGALADDQLDGVAGGGFFTQVGQGYDKTINEVGNGFKKMFGW